MVVPHYVWAFLGLGVLKRLIRLLPREVGKRGMKGGKEGKGGTPQTTALPTTPTPPPTTTT